MAKEDEEIKELGKKLAQNPDSMVFVQLADACRRAGDIEQSVEVCLRGLQRHPTYTTARLILGRNYLDLGKLEEASSEFRQIEMVDSENILAQRMLGQIALKKGLFAEAISRQQRVLGLDPDDGTAQELLQQALTQAKQSERAVHPSAPAETTEPARSPKNEHVQALKVADIYLKKHALNEAAEVVEEVLAADPHHADARQKLKEINALRDSARSRQLKEETLRKTEEEARRKTEEEARRKTEEEARRKTEEEARRKTEEEARRKTEEEARRKTEEEARRKTREEAKAKSNDSDKFSVEDIMSVISGSAEELIENEPGAEVSNSIPGSDSQTLIEAFIKAQAIEASLLLDAKGQVLHSQVSGDAAALGHLAGLIFRGTESAAKNVGFGRLKQIIITGEDNRQVIFLALSAGTLVAVTGRDTNLGLLRVAVNDLMKRA